MSDHTQNNLSGELNQHENVEFQIVEPSDQNLVLLSYPTGTGHGRLRNWDKNVNGEKVTFRSISKSSEGPFPSDSDFNQLIQRCVNNGYQVLTRTSVGTYYIKCKDNEVDKETIISTLKRNKQINSFKGSTTWVIIY